MLTTVETGNKKLWQVALPEIQLAINFTFIHSTRPLELLIGKVARPLQLMTLDTDETEIDLNTISDQVARLISTNTSVDKAKFIKVKLK